MDENDERDTRLAIPEIFSRVRADEDWQPDLQRGLAILRQRRVAAKRRGRAWAFAAIAAMTASIPMLAFPVTRSFAERWVSACVQETVAVREFLLGRSASLPSTTYVKPGDRRMAPEFNLTDSAGHRVRLSDARGEVVLLNFWATWCAPCEQEIPWFVEFQQANAERGFAVLGVAMDKSGWAVIKPYAASKKVNYPIVLGNDEVALLFGGKYFPMPLTLIIDRSGRIASIHAGLCRKDEYASDIETVLNER